MIGNCISLHAIHLTHYSHHHVSGMQANTNLNRRISFFYPVPIVFRDASLFGNRGLKRIIRTVREDRHNSIAHVFDNKPLEGSDDQTDLFIMAIYKIKHAAVPSLVSGVTNASPSPAS